MGKIETFSCSLIYGYIHVWTVLNMRFPGFYIVLLKVKYMQELHLKKDITNVLSLLICGKENTGGLRPIAAVNPVFITGHFITK